MKRRAAIAELPARGPAAKRPRSQIAMTQEIVKKELRKNTDWKYADYTVTSNAVYNNGQPVSLLTNLVRGTAGLNQFTGNLIKPQAITLKYFATSAQEAYEALRVVVFQWFDADTPVASGVLQTDATTTALVSPTLVTNKPYIRILYDKLHTLTINAYEGGCRSNGCVTGKVYIKGKKLRPIRYNATSNVCQDGNIYILALSDDTALGTVLFTMYSRITFSDQ